jgi:hypothetical protein
MERVDTGARALDPSKSVMASLHIPASPFLYTDVLRISHFRISAALTSFKHWPDFIFTSVSNVFVLVVYLQGKAHASH